MESLSTTWLVLVQLAGEVALLETRVPSPSLNRRRTGKATAKA
jgi:hypothetical protein